MGKRKVDISHKTILDLDYEMRQAFQNMKRVLPELQRKIAKIENQLSTKGTLKKSPKKLPLGKIQNLNRQLSSLKEEYDCIFNDVQLSEYSIETSDVLTKYKTQLSTKQTAEFVGGRKGKSDKSKLEAIENEYLEIARNFDTFGILPTIVNKEIICENCMGKDFDFQDERVYICKCGAVKEIETNTGCYRDCSRTNNSSDYQYERKLHFKDTIDCYCGTQNKIPKPEVCKKIIEVLYRYKIIDTLTPENWNDVDKGHVIMAMKELKIDEYNDAQLYHTHLTGRPGPDLSYIQKELFDDHDKITEVYREIMEEVIIEYCGKYERTSFLNGDYTLYQLLRRHGHVCTKSEFKMLKTTDPLILHDIVYSKVCKRFGWTMEKLA